MTGRWRIIFPWCTQPSGPWSCSDICLASLMAQLSSTRCLFSRCMFACSSFCPACHKCSSFWLPLPFDFVLKRAFGWATGKLSSFHLLKFTTFSLPHNKKCWINKLHLGVQGQPLLPLTWGYIQPKLELLARNPSCHTHLSYSIACGYWKSLWTVPHMKEDSWRLLSFLCKLSLTLAHLYTGNLAGTKIQSPRVYF